MACVTLAETATPACPACRSWYTYRLLSYMHEVPDLGSKLGGIKRLDRYDQLAEYVWGEFGTANFERFDIIMTPPMPLRRPGRSPNFEISQQQHLLNL